VGVRRMTFVEKGLVAREVMRAEVGGDVQKVGLAQPGEDRRVREGRKRQGVPGYQHTGIIS